MNTWCVGHVMPKMRFIIKLVGVIEGKISGNCNSLVGTGEEAKCCGEAEISRVTGRRKSIGG